MIETDRELPQPIECTNLDRSIEVSVLISINRLKCSVSKTHREVIQSVEVWNLDRLTELYFHGN